jgi:hypothetical protein
MANKSKINFKELESVNWTTFQVESSFELISIARELGEIIPSRKNSDQFIDKLTVKNKSDSTKKSLSSMFGKDAFPFHTDGAYVEVPPKYVLLRSMSKSDCSTILCDPKFNRKELKILTKDVWLVDGGRGKFYSNLIEEIGNDYRLRYDSACMRPALKSFSESYKVLNNKISTCPSKHIYWNKNQCVIFNNWKLIHSRSNAKDETYANRTLERIWIK